MNSLSDLQRLAVNGSLCMTDLVCDNDVMCLEWTSTLSDNVAQLHDTMVTLTVQKITEEFNILKGLCHDIFRRKLQMHQIVIKFVAQLLTQNQRQLCTI